MILVSVELKFSSAGHCSMSASKFFRRIMSFTEPNTNLILLKGTEKRRVFAIV